MKVTYTLLILLIPFIGYGQSSNSHLITASDYMIFTPSELTIIDGDTVYFENLTTHNAIQVSEETYNSNGTESIPNGFEVYSDSFLVFNSPGIYYYVCTPHVEMGMKGKINVLDFEEYLIDNIVGQWTDNDVYFEITIDSFLIYSFEQENCYELEEYSWVSDENEIIFIENDEFAGSFLIYNLTDISFLAGQTTDETTLLTSTSFSSSNWVECKEVTSILSFNIKSKKIVYILNVLGEKVNKPNDFSPYFYYYDDGTVEKRIVIE
jgi:plastocyanin